MDQRVKVLVQSADHLSVVGLTSYLASRPEIVLLPPDQRGAADVVVVAATELTAELATGLRRAAATASVPVVLVLNEIGDADPLTVANCRVAAILPREDVTGDGLSRTVLAAAAGRATMPQNVVVDLLEHVRRLRQELVAPTTGDSRLTARELDVLRLLADGLDTAEIATTLSYSERTVKNVLSGITTRLNLRNRPHAVAYALRKGLI